MDMKMITGISTAFVAALLMLSPDIADLLFGGAPAVMDIFAAPALVLSSIAAAIHEVGHLVTAWSFGVPALPIKDLTQEGKIIFYPDRAWLGQWLVWFFLIGFDLWLWFKKYKTMAVSAMFFTLAHIIVGSQNGHEFTIIAMGFTATAAAGIALLWRIFSGKAEESKVELYLGSFFGFYLYGRVLLLFISMASISNAKVAYTSLRETHLLADLETMAYYLNVSVTQIGSFGALFLIAAFAGMIGYAVKNNLD